MEADDHGSNKERGTGDTAGAVVGGDLLVAFRRLTTTLEHAVGPSFDGEYLDALDGLGALYAAVGDYPRALSVFYDALANHEHQGDEDGVARALMRIGAVLTLSGDLDSGSSHYARALEIFGNTGNREQELMCLSRIAETQLARGHLEQALEIELATMAAFEALGDTVNAAVAQATVGQIYERMGRPDVAMSLIKQALDVLRKEGDYRIRCSLLLQLSRLLSGSGNDGDARRILEEALNAVRDLDDLRLQSEVQAALAHVYERQGEFRLALEQTRGHAAIRERIAGEEKQKALAALRIRHDLERSEREREALLARTEELEGALDRKRAELAAQAMHLARQTELLARFRDELRSILRDADRAETAIKGIKEKLKELPCEAIDWSKFEQEFHQTYPEFRSRLTTRYPELTKMEAKICSLLKLRLSSADIANLLCLSERTVEDHRYRLRKKLGLETKRDLLEVLAEV